jgi:hypothetical protein
MNQEQICNHLKVWFVPKKLEALLNSKKRKALKTLPKGWESSSNSSFISPHSGRRFRSKNIALEAVHLFSDPICTPLLLGELAVRSLFSNETKRMRHLEREAEPLLDALRELLPDPEKIATKFGFTFENNENEEDEKDEQEKTLQRRRRRGRRIILAPSRDSFKDMCAKLEKPCTRRVKKEPKLPPEVPSENSLKRRYVFPIINLLKKLCFGRQSRHGRKDNIEALEKLMEDAGWEVKQRHAFGGMVLYFPPMPDLNFEDTDSEEESSSEEEEESSSEEEEESSSEEEDREKMDVEEGNDNEKEEGKDVESKDDEEEDSSEDSSESEEREEAPRIRSFEAALQWVQGHQDDLVEAARQRATLERREKIEALPDFVWGREKLGPKKTRIQRVQNHLEMMKTQFFDRFLKHSTQHKIIMREAAEEAARLLQSVVSIRKCGFEISIPVRVGRAARAFARLGSSIVSSPSDLKRLQEAAQVFVSENKSDQNLDRTYAISEKVECRWNGKDEFYTAVVDAVNDDGTYRLVYEDGDKEDHVADYLLRLPGDEEVVVKTSVGLEFYGRRGLRSAFGIVDYTNRCREELERLHSSSSSSLGRMSSSSPKRKKKKRRKRR